jgi:hypothetical protein
MCGDIKRYEIWISKETERGMFFTSIKWPFIKRLPASVISFLIAITISQAQVLQPQRVEIPLASSDDHYEITTGNENGLYLYRIFESPEGNQVHLVRLDTSFHEHVNGYMPVPKHYILIGKKCYKENFYLLFRFDNYSKNDLLLYIVDLKGQYTQYKIRGYIPFSPTELQITDHAVLIGGYYNKVPLVLHYSLKKMNSKVLPGIFNETGELTQIRTYEDGTFDVLISAFNHTRQRTIWLKNYDPDGNLNSNVALDPGNKHLIFGRSIKTTEDMQLVAGVYGSRSAQYSHGVFIASIDPAGIQQIKYYQFADLENFFKYMKAKREKRVKSRIERRKIKGKKVRMNYRFLVHELVPYQDQFILLGEAFYPKYRNIDRSYGSFFIPVDPGAIIQNGRIFEGYYYTHAIVMGFRPDGKLLWDNSFEINDVRTFTLEQFVKLEMQENKIALLYLFDNAIRTKIIQNNEVIEGKSTDEIEIKSEDEIVKRNYTGKSRLEYWYKDYLFASGIQEIESKVKSKNSSPRRVFFINKIKKTE